MRRVVSILVVFLTCVIATLFYLYAHGHTSRHPDNTYCADCVTYILNIDGMMRKHASTSTAAGAGADGNHSIRGNRYFRYAADFSCRGRRLLGSGRCVAFRRGLLTAVKEGRVRVGDGIEMDDGNGDGDGVFGVCREVGGC